MSQEEFEGASIGQICISIRNIFCSNVLESTEYNRDLLVILIINIQVYILTNKGEWGVLLYNKQLTDKSGLRGRVRKIPVWSPLYLVKIGLGKNHQIMLNRGRGRMTRNSIYIISKYLPINYLLLTKKKYNIYTVGKIDKILTK